ncbi:MAG: hypothetical protein ACKPGJ_16470 [Dolichospermum sp.]
MNGSHESVLSCQLTVVSCQWFVVSCQWFVVPEISDLAIFY